MTLRYQHLAPAYLRKAMTVLESYTQEAPAQPQVSGQAVKHYLGTGDFEQCVNDGGPNGI